MIGIDVVAVERLRAALERSPGLEMRLFTPEERSYCRSKTDPVAHFAGRLAAKEAAIKALRLGPLVAWATRIEVLSGDDGAPRARVQRGSGVAEVMVSISHDGPVAAAVALVQAPER